MPYQYDLTSELYNITASSGNEGAGAAGKIEYNNALTTIRNELVKNHREEMERAMSSPHGSESLKNTIKNVIDNKRINVSRYGNADKLTDRIYDDLLNYSFLTSYIQNEEVEEINVNRWDDIEVVKKGRYKKLKNTFASPEQAADIAKRMVQAGGANIDSAYPVVDSYLMKGVRIHAQLPPVIEKEAGAFISIRRQRKRRITAEELLRDGTLNDDILEFLTTAINYGVSTGFAGGTSSGKTTDLEFFLTGLSDDDRIYVVEDGSRELNLLKYDAETKRVKNRVVNTMTRYAAKDSNMQDVTPQLLAKAALRSDPKVIVIAEMRGAEAYEVQNAGRTGHQIVTTFHADSAADAYLRYRDMCALAQAGNVAGASSDTLLNYCYQSLPLMCYKVCQEDGVRRYTEIVEAAKQPDGSYSLVPIYRFYYTEGVVRNKSGRIIKKPGEFMKMNPISDQLAYTMFSRGADLDVIHKFSRPDYDPKTDGDGSAEFRKAYEARLNRLKQKREGEST